jgi:4-hydroxy-tetrahydrodipicolinate synthase
MKYKKSEAKEAARSILKGIWTAMPYSWDEKDEFDEAAWLQSMTQYGLQWLVNYNPHLYQVPGYLPIREYTQAAMAGDLKKAAEISRSLNPLRALHAKWINGYWRAGRMPLGEMKVWQEIIGMKGGPVRPPVLPVSDKARAEMEADLAATGILDYVRSSRIAAE